MEFGDALRDYLISRFPDARTASGGREVVMRCRFCGDSMRDRNARHMYVKVEGNVPFYNCFKCPAHGVLTARTLQSILVNYDDRDMAMLMAIKSHTKEISKYIKRTLTKNNTYRITNSLVTKDALSDIKLRYLNKRLGLNLTYKDLLENKIVLNLWDVLDENGIKDLTRNQQAINTLSDSSIGFLSMDNSSVTLKNLKQPGELNKYIDHKYNEYSIFKERESKKAYTIPSKSNLVSSEPIHIHIAEGTFDILSIFYNLRGANRIQNIYSAVCGRSYISLVKMYLKEFTLMNCIFHIYVDNDIPQRELEPIRTLLKALGIKGFIHRNGMQGQKDFGVRLELIKEIIETI